MINVIIQIKMCTKYRDGARVKMHVRFYYLDFIKNFYSMFLIVLW